MDRLTNVVHDGNRGHHNDSDVPTFQIVDPFRQKIKPQGAALVLSLLFSKGFQDHKSHKDDQCRKS